MSVVPDCPPLMGLPSWVFSTTLSGPAPLRSSRIFLAFLDCASPSPEALAPNRKGVRGCRLLSEAVGCPAGARFFARMIIFDMKKFLAAHDKLKCGGNRQFQPIPAHIPLRSENKKGVELVAPR